MGAAEAVQAKRNNKLNRWLDFTGFSLTVSATHGDQGEDDVEEQRTDADQFRAVVAAPRVSPGSCSNPVPCPAGSRGRNPPWRCRGYAPSPASCRLPR